MLEKAEPLCLERLEARILDLRKAYPRVKTPGLWGLLERYGLGENMLRVVRRSHETAAYKVRVEKGIKCGVVTRKGFEAGGGGGWGEVLVNTKEFIH